MESRITLRVTSNGITSTNKGPTTSNRVSYFQYLDKNKFRVKVRARGTVRVRV